MFESTAEAVTGLAGVDAIAITDATPEAAVIAELQAIVASAADFTELKTDIAAWTASP